MNFEFNEIDSDKCCKILCCKLNALEMAMMRKAKEVTSVDILGLIEDQTVASGDEVTFEPLVENSMVEIDPAGTAFMIKKQGTFLVQFSATATGINFTNETKMSVGILNDSLGEIVVGGNAEAIANTAVNIKGNAIITNTDVETAYTFVNNSSSMDMEFFPLIGADVVIADDKAITSLTITIVKLSDVV